MRHVNLLIVFFLMLGIVNIFGLGLTPMGDGTSSNPYMIDNLDNILWLSTNPDIWANGSYFEQTQDIDAYETNNWNLGEGFIPIGNNLNKFEGYYQGNNFSIINLFINRNSENYIGLFGYIKDSEIKNLNMDFVNISGNNYVGALVGFVERRSGNIKIEGCHVNGSIIGENLVGGLIGVINSYNNSNNNKSILVSYCSSNVDVNGIINVGGLIGESYASWSYAKISISNCYSEGSVIGETNVGGLVGKNSSNRGRTGSSYSSVLYCFTTNNVNGISNVGGLVGSNSRKYVHNYYYTYYSGASLIYCYTIGNISGSSFVGGIVGSSITGYTGQNYGCISRCYATGNITGNESVGGIAGDSQSIIEKCFWNVESTGQTTSAGIGSEYSISELEMKDEATYLADGWNFPSIWTINELDNLGYPHLTWYSFPEPVEVDIPENNTDLYSIEDTGVEIQFIDNEHSEIELMIREFDNFSYLASSLPESISSLMKKYWSISSSNPNLINYNLIIDLSQFEGLAEFSNIAVLKRANFTNSWVNVTALGGSTEIQENKIIISGLTTFSDFVVAITDDTTLPVNLSSFDAVQLSNESITISWTTESESNLIGYNVLRSSNDDYDSAIRLNPTIINATNSPVTSTYSYLDNEYDSALNYYWLESCDLGNENQIHGPISITVVEDEEVNNAPEQTILNSAYPNPFNPETNISFSVKSNDIATLTIYNLKGQIVKDFPKYQTGKYSIIWDGYDNQHNKVSSGLYFYRLNANSYNLTRKIMLMK